MKIDDEGYRLNVGIILLNQNNQLFWACRNDIPNAWQFPQGGVDEGETPVEAMYRELKEEVGLNSEVVKLIAESQHWLKYRLEESRIKRKYIGQKQKWFLLRFLGSDHRIDLTAVSSIEFCRWKWVDYWYPLTHIVEFKREVYTKVLQEFSAYISS